MRRSRGAQCWSGEGRWASVTAWGWQGGSQACAHRAPWWVWGMGHGLGDWRREAAADPQFLTLKVHRYPHVSLQQWKNKQTSGSRSCRLPGRAAAKPRGFMHLLHAVPSADEVSGECSHHTGWLHFRFLASGCKRAIHPASQAYPLLLLACCAQHKDCAFSSLLLPALHPSPAAA